MAAGSSARAIARLSSTLVLLAPRRGHPRFDFSVLMVGRHARSSSFPSAHVFPGGVVDEADYDVRWAKLLLLPPLSQQATAAVASYDGRLDDELGLRLAAIRELFEETGVMLVAEGEGRGSGVKAAAVRESAVWRKKGIGV